MKKLTLITLLLFTYQAYAQTPELCISYRDTLTGKIIYKTPEQMPEPVMGKQKWLVELSKSLRIPETHANYFGKVILAFVVDEHGQCIGLRVKTRNADTGDLMKKQLIAFLKKYPWKAGVCNGKAVPSITQIPVFVDLQRE